MNSIRFIFCSGYPEQMGRQKQLSSMEVLSALAPVAVALDVSAGITKGVSRPASGWLRSVRQLYGLSLKSIAAHRSITPQVLLRAEVAEAEERITIQNLRAIADSMGFDVVYCLVARDLPPLEALQERYLEAVARETVDGANDLALRALVGDVFSSLEESDVRAAAYKKLLASLKNGKT